MHYKEVKSILSPKNGMNLYRGCTHGCIYCDARSRCYHMDHVFEDIEVKENALTLLESALSKKRKKCMIGTGSMSDPYMHCEEKLLYTRKSLELILQYGFGVAIQTKSDRILRDFDLLKQINDKTKCVMQMTLTTFDESLCKKIEPHVATTKERFEVLMRCKEVGIPTVVWIDPILPFINDTKENLKGLLDYCIRANVYGIICFNMGLTLREGNREYFYEKLDEMFPGLKQRYVKTYGYQYELISKNNTELMKLLHDVCRREDIVCDPYQVFQYMATFEEKQSGEQLDLFSFLEK